jgi:hypothetical protein
MRVALSFRKDQSKMTILWMILNCMACAWFSHAVLINPVEAALETAMRKWGNRANEKTVIGLLGILLLLHCGVAAVLYVFTSAAVTALLTSLLAFAWTITAYFLLQRFSDFTERPLMVHENPNFYPSAAFIAFVASTTACIVYGRWFLACLPIATWFILGFMCTEIAIRRIMRGFRESGTECDRDLAVYVANQLQGRRDPVSVFFPRYPFP